MVKFTVQKLSVGEGGAPSHLAFYSVKLCTFQIRTRSKDNLSIERPCHTIRCESIVWHANKLLSTFQNNHSLHVAPYVSIILDADRWGYTKPTRIKANLSILKTNYHSFSQPNVRLARLQMELSGCKYICSPLKSKVSIFYFVEIFGL